MRQTIASKTPRIEVVDALRGFAVMAILLVHNLEHFIFPVYPAAASQPGWLNILDEGVFSVTFSLFAGKAYAIFALLIDVLHTVYQPTEERQGFWLPFSLASAPVGWFCHFECGILPRRRCVAAILCGRYFPVYCP